MADTDEPPAKRARTDREHFVVPDDLEAGPADIILESSNEIRFLCHKAYLKTSCRAFNSMLLSTGSCAAEGSSDGLPIVKLEETAEVLDYLLPYCYNVSSRHVYTAVITIARCDSHSCQDHPSSQALSRFR